MHLNPGALIKFDGAAKSAREALRPLQLLEPGLLKAGFKRSTGWVHTATALFVFASDVLKPVFPHCTLWVLVAALVAFAALIIAVKRQRITAETFGAVVVFCLTTAVLSLGMIGLQKYTGDPDGALHHLVPGVEKLQKTLDLVEPKIDALNTNLERAANQQQELLETNRLLIERLRQEKGVPIQTLAQILTRLGATTMSSDPAEVEQKLRWKADEYVVLRRQVAQLSGEDPRVNSLQREAASALANSDFGGARAKLRAAAEIDRAAVETLSDQAKKRALDAAKSYEESARVATTAIEYRAAAADLAEAVKLVTAYDRKRAIELMIQEAEALKSQGVEFGDNPALKDSIGIYRDALTLVSLTDEAKTWAGIQFNLGGSLVALGERESGTAHLKQAVTAYRAALEEFKAEPNREARAAIRFVLGRTLWLLSMRESDTSSGRDEAEALYRAALEELAPERVPLLRAFTQTHLTLALQRIDKDEIARLEAAVTTYRATLGERIWERNPLDWGRVQIGLGMALLLLGADESETATARLEEAVASFRASVEAFTHKRAPPLWAAAQTALAIAAAALGERRNDATRLEEAVSALRAAMQEFTRERAPYRWAEIQDLLGDVLKALGDRESGTAHLEEAFQHSGIRSLEFT